MMTCREFVEFLMAYDEGELPVFFEGEGIDEKAIVTSVREVEGLEPACAPGTEVVWVDPRYFRPTEVETLLGDPTKAKEKLGWEPRIGFEKMVAEMVQEDLELAKRDELCKTDLKRSSTTSDWILNSLISSFRSSLGL